MEEGKIIAVEIVNNGLSIEVIISIIAVIFAFISSFSAIRSNHQAKKSNDILLKQYIKSLPRIKICSKITNL